MAAFLHRYVDVLKEGHSVLGMLPGCYDGWLLDNEGQVPDPFTRQERLLALGLRTSFGVGVEYAFRKAVASEYHQSFKAEVWPVGFAVDKLTKVAVKEGLDFACGASRCKDIMQRDWDRQSVKDSSEGRKAALAQAWAGAVTVAGALYFSYAIIARESADAADAAVSFMGNFAKDALVVEPLVLLVKLAASAVLGKPVGGVSYAKRKISVEA